MDEYTAVFEIDSKSDAYAVERLMNRMYDSLREESRTLAAETSDSTDMLTQFKTIRDVARTPTPGKLTLIYETRNDGFDE